MNLLASLIAEGQDLTELPYTAMEEIQKNIRDGAKDLEQQWANALHLVQKAYEVAGVQRPDPEMGKAWKQYEENLQYAVQQLAKYRGMDGDWRMSSAIFREAMSGPSTFRVCSESPSSKESWNVYADRIEDIVETIRKRTDDDVTVNKSEDGSMTLLFSKYGVKRNHRLKIHKNVLP